MPENSSSPAALFVGLLLCPQGTATAAFRPCCPGASEWPQTSYSKAQFNLECDSKRHILNLFQSSTTATAAGASCAVRFRRGNHARHNLGTKCCALHLECPLPSAVFRQFSGTTLHCDMMSRVSRSSLSTQLTPPSTLQPCSGARTAQHH